MEEIKKGQNFFEILKKANSDLAEFFGFELPEPEIIVAKSRYEYDMITGNKTEPWQIGRTLPDDSILILSPECWVKDAPMHNPAEIDSLVKHELVHLYERRVVALKNISFPVWMREGLAVYISGQLTNHKLSKRNVEVFSQNISSGWSDLVSRKIDCYGSVGYFMKFLLEDRRMSLSDIIDLLKQKDTVDIMSLMNDFISTIKSYEAGNL